MPHDSYPKLQSLLHSPPLLCSSSLLILSSLSPGRGFCFYKSSITEYFTKALFLLAHIPAFSRKRSHFHSPTLLTSSMCCPHLSFSLSYHLPPCLAPLLSLHSASLFSQRLLTCSHPKLILSFKILTTLLYKTLYNRINKNTSTFSLL